MKKRSLLLLFIALLLTMGGCSYFSSSSNLVLEGVVETSVVSQYCEVGGKIVQLPIELGQTVKAGDLIAVIDDSSAKYNLEQLQAGLAKKQAGLDDLYSGSTAAEIKQGRDNIDLAQGAGNSAQIAFDSINTDYGRIQILYEGGAVSQSAWEDAKNKLDQAAISLSSAQTQVDAAQQKLNVLVQGPGAAKVAAAEADIALSESQIRQAQDNLAKYRIAALSDGIIISKNYLLGNIVTAGFDLADIASNTEQYLVAYLPEDNLPKISYGQELTIRRGQQEYQGVVSFIDAQAQYTPKDLQTAANKNKSSVKIKIRLAPDNPLKTGEKAQLLIP